MKKVGDVVRIRARGEVSKLEDGMLSIVLSGVDELTEDVERARIAEKDGVLSDEDLGFIFEEVGD